MFSRVDRAPTFQRSPERELVGVLEVAADRQTRSDTGDREPERLQHARQVHRSDLASVLGLVQTITSWIPSGPIRASNSRILSCSGPMPSRGLIAPSST